MSKVPVDYTIIEMFSVQSRRYLDNVTKAFPQIVSDHRAAAVAGRF